MDAYLENALAKLADYISETPIATIKQDIIDAGHGYYPIETEKGCSFFATSLALTATSYAMSATYLDNRAQTTNALHLTPESYAVGNNTNSFASSPTEFDYKAAA